MADEKNRRKKIYLNTAWNAARRFLPENHLSISGPKGEQKFIYTGNV